MAEGDRGSQVAFHGWGRGEGVHEIDPWLVGVIRQKRTSVVTFQLPPAHMGDPLPLAAGQFVDATFQQAKTILMTLVTALEQQLETQADAKQGSRVGMPLLQGGHQA